MAYEPTLIEGARLIFRHFSGDKDSYHSAGQRDFSVTLDTETAEAMERDGWNIKWLEPREEGDLPQAILKVKVNFTGRPPQVTMVTSRNKTRLDEDTVGLLDYADIVNADLFITPYDWTVNGRSGRAAYLEKLFVTIREDELDLKYGDIPYADAIMAEA